MKFQIYNGAAAVRGRVGLRVLLLGGMLGVGTLALAEDPLPKAVPATKYAKMAARSPFAPPTAVLAPQATPPPPPAPGWADSLTVTMIMQDGNKYMVTVVDSANQQQHLYLTMEPDKQTQMSVASVKWGASREDPPTITLRKGKDTAQVRYESGSNAPGTPNGMGGAPPIPGVVRNPVPAVPGGGGMAAFHPPPMPNSQVNGGPATAVRRPLIRSQPMPPARPAINQPAAGVRPNPAAKADDDDDDD